MDGVIARLSNMDGVIARLSSENTDVRVSSNTDLFLSRRCYQIMFWEMEYFHGQCCFELFNKIMGYLLISTVSIAYVPQIFKILKSRSGEGISVFSILLTLQAASVKVAYCIMRAFSFSSWGESLFLMLQYLTVSCLLLRYRFGLMSSIAFVLVYLIIMIVLLGPIIPTTYIVYLKAINLPMVAASKVIQICTNYRNKGTGQLSRVTLIVITLRSLGRLFTAIFETGDSLLIWNYINLFIWNSILLSQMIYYRGVKMKTN